MVIILTIQDNKGNVTREVGGEEEEKMKHKRRRRRRVGEEQEKITKVHD